MSKLHIKKGDTVYVNAGEDKGKTGRVLSVLVKEQRAIVEGINMVSKHTKPYLYILPFRRAIQRFPSLSISITVNDNI